jgi:uncharacterized membrane protein YhaH (DUF805 family)
MVPKEVVEEIAKYLLGLTVLVSFLWYVIYRHLEGWSKRKPFIYINAVILIIYTIYFINGRICHSEYGGALVWDFYMLLVPFIHTILMGVASLIVKKKVNGD